MLLDRDPGQTFLSLSEVSALLPPGRRGARVHPSTVLRWVLAGVRAVGGRRVHLKAVRCGSRWLVTREWLDKFFADCAGPMVDEQPPPRTPTQRRRAHQQATAALDSMGI